MNSNLIFSESGLGQGETGNQLAVSVIIPTYNRADWLKEAIQSVVDQTFKNVQLILVDDGSTEDISTVVRTAGVTCEYVRQERKGVSASRNTGIKTSRGEYIAFLDSDDLWNPRKLELQVQYMHDNPSMMLVHTDEIWLRNNRRVNPRNIHRKYGGWIFDKSLELCLVSPSSVLIHRELFMLVGMFDESLPACEDYDLWLRITSLFPVGYIREPLIIKRGGHPDQLSKKHWGMDRFRVQSILNLLDRNILSHNQRLMAIETLKRKCDILVAGSRKRKKFDVAEQYETIRTRFS